MAICLATTHPIRLNDGKVCGEDFRFWVRICEVDCPFARPASNVQYTVQLCWQGRSDKLAPKDQKVDVMLHVHTLLFCFIIRHGIFARSKSMVPPAILIFVCQHRIGDAASLGGAEMEC